MTDNGRRYLPTSPTCFVCGEHNQAGLQQRFFVEDDVVKTVLRPKEHHCGYANTVHGGIVATILDETMGWAANRELRRMCITADITVRYKFPVPADVETLVCARVIKSNRRLVYLEGWIEDPDGQHLAKAEARFMPLSEEETKHIDDHMIYREHDERPFE
jgi:uncharacterized protein (TIGR00369 family)